MAELERRLQELPMRSPAAILDLARDFMDQTEALDQLVADLLEGCRSDPFFRPPFFALSSDIHSGLLLFHNEHLSIALGVTGLDMLAFKKGVKRGATSIGFTGVVSLFRYLKAGDATVSFWEAPPITSKFGGSEAGDCQFVGRRMLRDGEELLSDGRYESFIIEHATSDMVYFQAMVRAGSAPLAVEYDSRTMKFVGASSTDEASSRVLMMVSLLRAMERDDAAPLVAELLDSPLFYTRWHVMRELLAMDAEAALPHLRRMAASDPHPEVRAAAAETLGLFFQTDESEEGASVCLV
jgi:hypothetical protein